MSGEIQPYPGVLNGGSLSAGTTAQQLRTSIGLWEDDTPVLDATNFNNVPDGTPEGTAILSTGETGGTKYLRENGDGTCSWQAVAGGVGSSPTFLGVTLSGNISSPAWSTNGVRIKAVAATITNTTSSGTVAVAYTNRFNGNTIAASSATTFTGYYGSYFANPTAGTNVTFTKAYALGCDSLNVVGPAYVDNSASNAFPVLSLNKVGPDQTLIEFTQGSGKANFASFKSDTAENVSLEFINNFAIVGSSTSTTYGIGTATIPSGDTIHFHSINTGANRVCMGVNQADPQNDIAHFRATGTTKAKITYEGVVLSTSSTGGVGYGTGSGGSITQATSRTTGVTINRPSGAITLVSAAGSVSWQSFTVTNSTITATDTIIVNQKSGTDKYQVHVTAVAAGSFQITYATTGGTTTEQPVFSFSKINGVTS